MLTSYTESYMKVLELELELLRPATPSNGRPNPRVCPPAARVRDDRLSCSCAPRRSGSPPRSRKKRRKEDLAVEEGVNEVLAWARVHRPKNTARNYLPKQREWKVSSPLLFFYVVLLLIYKYL
jgi:hypothetical protein